MEAVAGHTHLYRRGAVYWFRRRVPEDVVSVVGHAQWRSSLGTKDFEEAKRLVRVRGVETDREVALARARLAGKASPPLTKPEANRLAQQWVDVTYVGEQFDNGPSGSIIKQLKRVMAGEYSRELSAKVKHAKRRNAALGLHQGGPCPFGVARLEERPDGSPVRVLARGERKSRPENILRYVHGDPGEIALVKRIFDLYLIRKMRAAEIGRLLTAEGHTWTDGQPITFQQVRRVLSCDLLTGRLVSGKEEHFLGGRREKRPRSEWLLTNVFTPIISPARFRAAEQRRLSLGGVIRRGNDEALLKVLRKAREAHGPLTIRIVNQSKHCPASTNYERAFGSFGRALELIGEKAPRNYLGGQLGHRIPEANLIDAMRRLEDRHGYVSATLLRAAPDAPPAQTYIKAFGSLKAACHAAGVATRSTRKIIIPAANPWRD